MNKILLILILTFSLSGCAKDDVPNISSEYILSNITKVVSFENAKTENLKEQDIAERYGISPTDLENGVVYYSSNKDKSDKIIIIKAVSKDKLENIERALSAEIIGVTDSWKANERESKKIEKHILKTRDVYVMFSISDKNKEIEEAFDKCFK